MRFIKNILALIILPVALGTAKSFYYQISVLGDLKDHVLLMEHGALTYLLIHTLIFRPVYLYVLGHECVHVLATWISGGRVESFNVSSTGGGVVTSKTNFFIKLSPYFVPIYAIAIAPIFWLVKNFIDVSFDIETLFMFTLGFTLAFHIVMTTEVLKMKQPDMDKLGPMLSLIIIFTFNMFIVMAVFSPIFEDLSFISFLKSSYRETLAMYEVVYSIFNMAARTVSNYF